jgi:hypothetical protein
MSLVLLWTKCTSGLYIKVHPCTPFPGKTILKINYIYLTKKSHYKQFRTPNEFFQQWKQRQLFQFFFQFSNSSYSINYRHTHIFNTTFLWSPIQYLNCCWFPEALRWNLQWINQKQVTMREKLFTKPSKTITLSNFKGFCWTTERRVLGVSVGRITRRGFKKIETTILLDHFQEYKL